MQHIQQIIFIAMFGCDAEPVPTHENLKVDEKIQPILFHPHHGIEQPHVRERPIDKGEHKSRSGHKMMNQMIIALSQAFVHQERRLHQVLVPGKIETTPLQGSMHVVRNATDTQPPIQEP